MTLRATFCADPALSRVEPPSTSAPVSSSTATSAVGGRLAGGVVDHRDRGGADVAGVGERRQHVRRAARRGDAHHDVARVDVERGEVGAAGVGVVLGALDGRGRRLVAAGAHRHHPVGVDAEGGRALGGVGGPQPPGRAGADVDDPPAAVEGAAGELDGAGQGRPRGRERRRHGGLGGEQDPDQVVGGARVEVGQVGSHLLGGEQVDVGGGAGAGDPDDGRLVRQVGAAGQQQRAVERGAGGGDDVTPAGQVGCSTSARPPTTASVGSPAAATAAAASSAHQ